MTNMKMTNKEDIDGGSAYDSHFAAFLAVHLVRKILDDACFIVNATAQSGQSRCYESGVEDIQQPELNNEDHKDVSYKGESDVTKENNIDLVANIVTTSTPQKDIGDNLKCMMEANFIGQGDEDLDNIDYIIIDVPLKSPYFSLPPIQNDLFTEENTSVVKVYYRFQQQDESTISTSVFINHLFDMSELEKVLEYNDNIDNIQNNAEGNEFIVQDIRNIIDSYINIALGIAYKQACEQELGGTAVEDNSSTEESGYSLLSDAFTGDVGPDIAFYIQDNEDLVANSGDVTDIVPAVQIIEKHDENLQERMQRNDVARLESAYLSLNRDYEQSCEDDGRLIIEDTKGMTLQEVELLTADSSDENLSRHDEAETEDKNGKAKELTAVSAVSAVSKKSLVSRCRSQGARLLSCLRGWWRRKIPGQRKEHQQRVTGGARGLCPLSPDARRRAASLVDQRLLRSPSPSRSVVWKFNTVNETVVNSSHWKDYTFEEQPHDCGEGYIT